MDMLLAFLNGLEPDAREAFAVRCGTTLAYLRKAISIGQRLGEGLCIAIERESGGALRCESLRHDVDWAFIRGTAKPTKAKGRAPSEAKAA